MPCLRLHAGLTWRLRQGSIGLQVYGRDFFTGIAACIPANAAPKGQVVAAKGLSQTVEFALGDSLAANVQT